MTCAHLTTVAVGAALWQAAPMRVMGLDIGSVRIGVAMSDPGRRIASPLETVQASPRNDALARIAALAREHEVSLVVFGLPVQLDGREGHSARRIRAFAERVERACRVPVEPWDERFTSAQAELVLLEGNVKRAQRKQVVDRVAAAMILQAWLDAQGYVT